jgi:hypothetical protein
MRGLKKGSFLVSSIKSTILCKEELTMNETAYGREYSTLSNLYLAFELGNKEWKLGFTIGQGQSPRRRRIDAGDLAALRWEIGQAKKRFGLPEATPVLSCTVLRQHGL